MADCLRKGGDTSGRLASTPTIARGSFDLAESGLGRYTDILHSIFTMPVGARRRLEKIMRSFLWRGSQPDEARGTALVAWSTVCRPINQGWLGIRHLQHTNMALLTKWVCWMMQPLGDLVTVVLRDGYGSSLD